MKIAIISGASSGIGKSIVRQLDNKGLDQLWLIGRSKERLEEIKNSLRTPALILAYDLNDRNIYHSLQLQLKDACATIEYLVLSAGVGYNGGFDTVTLDNISDMININCTSLTLLSKIALPYMDNGSKLISIASGAGYLPQPYFAVYAATKAYVISFSKGLRQELKSRKIKVCAACPGPVDTEFFAGLKDVKDYKKKYLISPERVARGVIKAADKNKAIYSPTFSMKAVHLMSKLIPTSIMLKFYNE